MEDISASGINVLVKGSKTFPNGFNVTLFADDGDPFDLPSLQIASGAMNVNGILVTWTAPQPLTPTINVIPGSADDNNLSILAEANRAAANKVVARDIITIVATYPDGSTLTLSDGKITNATLGKSVASAGRYKSKPYVFMFQDIAITRASAQ